MRGGRAMSRRLQQLRAPLIPDRVREIKGQSFAYLSHRFLRDGFLSSLAGDELYLYIFLLLASNRKGVSFYGLDAICAVLRIPLERYLQARNSLIAKDLVAFDGTRFQVLALPKNPVCCEPPRSLNSPEDFEDRDPATIRAILRHDLGLE